MIILRIFDFIRNSINVSTTLFWNFVFLHIYHKHHFKKRFGIVGFGILLSLFAISLDELYKYITGEYEDYVSAEYHRGVTAHGVGL